jgi:hypothetical protein
MSNITSIFFIIFGVTTLFGCVQNTNEKLSINNCDNIFVVSDREKIYLFEHENNIISFHLLRTFENWSNNGAFFDCKRNIVVSPYGYKGEKHDKGGVTIFDLNNGKVKDYEISDGVNGQLGLFENGVLLSTMLIHTKEIDKKSGYVPPKSILDKNMVIGNPEMFPVEVVDDYKAGKLWKMFEYIHLFDLDRKEIVKSYEQNADYGSIFEDKFYAQFIDAVGIINLKNNFREKIIERDSVSDGKNSLHLSKPANTIGVFVDKVHHVITTQHSWDFSSGRNQRINSKFKKNALYKVESEKLIELAVIPFEDISYAVVVEKNIFIFSSNAKNVAKYDTSTNKLTKYHLSIPALEDEYTIDSVGHTENSFIFALSIAGSSKGLLFLTNKSFTKISSMYEVPMSDMSVTTDIDIQTTNLRAVKY